MTPHAVPLSPIPRASARGFYWALSILPINLCLPEGGWRITWKST